MSKKTNESSHPNNNNNNNHVMIIIDILMREITNEVHLNLVKKNMGESIYIYS